MSHRCHDHQDCIEQALKAAIAICHVKGVRLTPLRQQVLELVWHNHKPLGAYDLIDMLSRTLQKRVAPPTVYRALDFLLEVGLIHRIHSLSAYIGCHNPQAHVSDNPKAHYFLICQKCHTTEEYIEEGLSAQIHNVCQTLGFTAKQQWLEVNGICSQCQ